MEVSRRTMLGAAASVAAAPIARASAQGAAAVIRLGGPVEMAEEVWDL